MLICWKVYLQHFVWATSGTSKEIYVVVEKVVVYKFASFVVAMVYSFCCYFVLDMEYPKKAALTLEFFQRYF